MESDWKTFRRRVPEWRERYLKIKNKEIIAVLTDEHKTPTEQFWGTMERMEKEAQILVDCLDDHSRSKMHWSLLLMHRHGLIQDADLEEFSDDLREQIMASSRSLGT
jgi:hypothetical protein